MTLAAAMTLRNTHGACTDSTTCSDMELSAHQANATLISSCVQLSLLEQRPLANHGTLQVCLTVRAIMLHHLKHAFV